MRQMRFLFADDFEGHSNISKIFQTFLPRFDRDPCLHRSRREFNRILSEILIKPATLFSFADRNRGLYELGSLGFPCGIDASERLSGALVTGRSARRQPF